ncbi:MAG: hypothetical protein KAJ17_13860 [Candidatus Krumholzibacteria bacterium]|nr:hypothetical protein [Candidatus Krumholzibacteria bacterium]
MQTFKLIAVIMMAAMMILAVGCKESPTAPPVQNQNNNNDPDLDPDPTGVDARLVGIWVFTGATVGGRTADLGEVLEWQPTSALAAFQIDADGFFAYVEINEDWEETYYDEGTISTNRDRFEISSPNLTTSGTWQRSGNVLTLSSKMGEDTVKLMAEKIEESGEGYVVGR